MSELLSSSSFTHSKNDVHFDGFQYYSGECISHDFTHCTWRVLIKKWCNSWHREFWRGLTVSYCVVWYCSDGLSKCWIQAFLFSGYCGVHVLWSSCTSFWWCPWSLVVFSVLSRGWSEEGAFSCTFIKSFKF